jgi:toluene monooxygenase system protein E
VKPARTYWHLADVPGTPSDYDVATSKLLYYVNRGFEVAVPLADWYRTHQTGSPLTCDDWERFRDPRETAYADYVARRAASQDAAQEAAAAGLELLLAPALHLFHGLQMISAYVGQMAPSGRLTIVAALQAADEMRAVERLARRIASLRAAQPGLGADGKQRWQADPGWQPARRLAETMLVTYDWAEAFTALNLCAKPALDAFFWPSLREPTIADDAAWHRAWSAALVAVVVESNPANRGTLAAWIERWNGPVREAVLALGALAGPAGEDAARAAVEQAEAWQRRIGLAR